MTYLACPGYYVNDTEQDGSKFCKKFIDSKTLYKMCYTYVFLTFALKAHMILRKRVCNIPFSRFQLQHLLI